MAMTSDIFVARVTDVDSYDFFRASEGKPWEISTEQFLKNLREFEATPVMRAGSLGHKTIENATRGDIFNVVHDGDITLRFKADDINVEAMPIREQWLSKWYLINGVKVQLRGRMDAAKPGLIVDYKFGKYMDAEKFADAFQWRAYLDMAGPNYWEFMYSMFKMIQDEDEPDTSRYYFDIVEHEEVTFCTYKRLHDDVRERLAEFVEFSRMIEWEGRKPPPAKYIPAEID